MYSECALATNHLWKRRRRVTEADGTTYGVYEESEYERTHTRHIVSKRLILSARPKTPAALLQNTNLGAPTCGSFGTFKEVLASGNAIEELGRVGMLSQRCMLLIVLYIQFGIHAIDKHMLSTHTASQCLTHTHTTHSLSVLSRLWLCVEAHIFLPVHHQLHHVVQSPCTLPIRTLPIRDWHSLVRFLNSCQNTS
jgi:hypothetical protein